MSWDEEVDKLVGKNLRTLRIASDLTQGALADLVAANDVPMSQQTIAKIENGTRSLRFSEAAVIVDLLEDTRLEHLIYTSAELANEQEAQHMLDRLLPAFDKIHEGAKDAAAQSLAAMSFLEEISDANGRAASLLKAFIKDSPAGLFNFVRAGIREALEETWADAPTYSDAPDYVKPFIAAAEGNREPEA